MDRWIKPLLQFFLNSFGNLLHATVRGFVDRYIFFEGLYFQENFILKTSTLKNKDNKISQGRGNSLRNEVRGWVEHYSPDPLKPLPTG